MLLVDLINQAEEKKQWLFHAGENLLFSPKHLRKCLASKTFDYPVEEWQMMNPIEFALTQFQGIINEANNLKFLLQAIYKENTDARR